MGIMREELVALKPVSSTVESIHSFTGHVFSSELNTVKELTDY